MNQITKQIFIGDWLDAQEKGLLDKYGINAIVNVSPDNGNVGQVESYVWVPLHDGPGNKFEDFARAVFELDDLLLGGKTVLVHCHVGMSRSPSVVICWLSWKKKISIKDAFLFVREARPVFDPNKCFRELIEQFLERYGEK